MLVEINRPKKIWNNLNDINNTLRDIESFYHNLRLKKIQYLLAQQGDGKITDYELDLNIRLYIGQETIISHNEYLSMDGLDLSGGSLDMAYLTDELFGNLEFDHENILLVPGELCEGPKGKLTQATTEKPFCWLAHQITHDYNISLQTLLKTDQIWCDLVIREQIRIELLEEMARETFNVN